MFGGAIIRPTQVGGDARGIKEDVEQAYDGKLRVFRFSEGALLRQEMLAGRQKYRPV